MVRNIDMKEMRRNTPPLLKRPIIYAYFCLDSFNIPREFHGDNFQDWIPPDPSEVIFILDLAIGFDDDIPGSDYFEVWIATPRGLKKNKDNRSLRYGKKIVMNEYSWSELVSELDKIMEMCQGYTWEEMTGKLRQFLHWEYENYKE